jgi:hypothetical protein
MRKPLILVTVIFAGIISIYYFYIIQQQRSLYKTVKTDFVGQYPGREFIECEIDEVESEGTDVHLKFKQSVGDSIHEERWRYRRIDNAWMRIDR